jgi:hypothetical protein
MNVGTVPAGLIWNKKDVSNVDWQHSNPPFYTPQSQFLHGTASLLSLQSPAQCIWRACKQYELESSPGENTKLASPSEKLINVIRNFINN